jgi:hypothetical protein
MQHGGIDRPDEDSGVVDQRVRTAFPEQTDSEEAVEYLSELRGRMKDVSEISRRTILLLLLTAATFELLNRAAVVNVKVGPFEIKDLSLIQKVLPVVFAYLIYDECVLGVRYLYSMRVADTITQSFQPSLSKATLDKLLHPQGSSLLGPMTWHRSRSLIYRLTGVFTVILRVGSVITPLVIEIYAFYSLRRQFGLNDAIVAFSLAFSLGFLAYSALIVLTGIRDGLIPLTRLLGPR